MNEGERAQAEEAGFEALQRLYAAAIDPDQPHAGVVARFLLGLYNGTRFPFDLTDLRLLSNEQFNECIALLRLDARFTRQEIHHYFHDGGQKFERLVSDWGVQDVYKLRETGDGAPRPPAERGVLHHGDDVSARLVTHGDAPGYRDVTLVLDCEVVGHERKTVGPVRLDVRLSAEDGATVLWHILQEHRFAWRSERGPLDRKPGEKRPVWLDRP